MATRQEIESEINAYKQLLTQTDYKALKHADGIITDDEYAEVKALRQSYRDAINELEGQKTDAQEAFDALSSRPSKAELVSALEASGITPPAGATNPQLYAIIEAAAGE